MNTSRTMLLPRCSRHVLSLLIIGLCVIHSTADVIRPNKPECVQMHNTTSTKPYTKQILLWQGVVLIICFGAFALFVALINRIVRTYIYYDSHLLDTFFDAGSDACSPMVAVSVVAKWVWAATIVHSSTAAVKFGLAGHFWYSAAGCIQIFLFAIMAAEIRIKAPGAKTYLQVIKARFGTTAHVILITFSLIASVLIVGMVTTEGVNLITSMVNELGREVTTVIIAIVVSFFTVVGGVGGYMYVAYFSVAFIISCVLVIFTDTYYNPSMRSSENIFIGNKSMIYSYLTCGKGHSQNQDYSLLTFVSQRGLMHAVVLILSSFSPVFVSQSFWQSGVSAKPGSGVLGFLAAGITWFAIPFTISFSLGLGYWVLKIRTGAELVNDEDTLVGLIPVFAAQKMMGITGDFLMYCMIVIAVITTASSEVLASSSIIVYDIYQTYIAPFRTTPIPEGKPMSIRMQKAIRNEEYLEYDRRCVVLKHVVVVSMSALLIPITLVIMAIKIDVMWLYQFTGIIVGSCVIPIALAITWHRITGPGVSTGALAGFICGFCAWLIFSSRQDGGLEDFRKNTGKPEAMLVGNAVAIGAGGLFCFIVSLTCGGCDKDLVEDEEWEKTRYIDSCIVPWHVKYAPDIGQSQMKNGRPHFYTVRFAFKKAEVSAYLFGVVFAVIIVLIWPAVMLQYPVDSMKQFGVWTTLVLVWSSVSAIYLIVFPLVCEIYQTCRQSYYNRMWAKAEQRDRLSIIASSTLTSRKDPNELEDGTINPGYDKTDDITGLPGMDVKERLEEPSEVTHEPSESPREFSESQHEPSESSGNHASDTPLTGLDCPDKETEPHRWKTFIHLD